MAGLAGHVDYDAVPGIVYTAPEVATLGKSEEILKAEGISYARAFSLSGKQPGQAMGHTDGFAKILACPKLIGCLVCISSGMRLARLFMNVRRRWPLVRVPKILPAPVWSSDIE